MSTTFTPARIAELRALGAKATTLPYRQHLVDDTTIIAEDGTEIACTFPQGGIDDDVDFATDVEQKERDAAFLAAAANTLPAALDEIERLRAENARLRKALSPFACNCGRWCERYRTPETCSEGRARRALEGDDA